jgi:hypothetical protein
MVRGLNVLHNGELRNLCSVSDIIRGIKWRGLCWLERLELRIEFTMKACDIRAWREFVWLRIWIDENFILKRIMNL